MKNIGYIFNAVSCTRLEKKLETAVELPTYGKYCSNENTQKVTESA